MYWLEQKLGELVPPLPSVPGPWTPKTFGGSWKVGFLCTCCIYSSILYKIIFKKRLSKNFLQFDFFFFSSVSKARSAREKIFI